MPELDLQHRGAETIWFADRACVVVGEQDRQLFAGGSLLGTFDSKDFPRRNALLAIASEQQGVHLGQLARAFDLSPIQLRRTLRQYEAEGIQSIVREKLSGRPVEVSDRLRARLEELFEAGLSVNAAHERVGTRRVSRATVGRIRQQWAQRREGPVSEPAPPAAATAPRTVPPHPSDVGPAATENTAIRAVAPQTHSLVQHLGSWVLISTVHSLGLYARAASIAGERVGAGALRIALDATISTLGAGQRCIEGVRRLATSSASALLLTTRVPSAPWLRTTLGRAADDGGGVVLHMQMARAYVAPARDERNVFYVDNHLRPYTGQHVLRKGWRMQDKRVRPGASDYYVHDEDGRMVARLVAPHHGSLTEFLALITTVLRLALPTETILLAFDRAGAFPEQMATLRDEGFEFVTYERRPYPLLAPGEFTEKLTLEDEELTWCEPHQKNLGGGRGRVRRICVRTADGRQVNLVAHSTRTAQELIDVMRGRWIQENGFKHGNERWGINQLDGRTVVPYSPDTVVPNPARRRLDHALRIARAQEGQLRVQLSRLSPQSDRRSALQHQLQQALAQQRRLEAQRPSAPTHAQLCDTELAGKLVHHTVDYKLLVDTIRIACANAESELAACLGAELPRAAEAKKTLANIFAAPGRLHVSPRSIVVTLHVAANERERAAISRFFSELNRQRPTHPGDDLERPIRFQLASRHA